MIVLCRPGQRQNQCDLISTGREREGESVGREKGEAERSKERKGEIGIEMWGGGTQAGRDRELVEY